MNSSLLALVAKVDALRLPHAGSVESGRHKEWHHFNLRGEGYHVILNLGIQGGIGSSGQSGASVILIAYHPRHGWTGTADSYPVGHVAAIPGRVDLAIGQQAVRYDGSQYALDVALKDGTLSVSAQLRPQAASLPIRNHARFGSGTNDWTIVPRLAAQGQLRIGHKCASLDGTLAYHDHNSGYWDWHDDLGWDWGFALEDGEDGYSVVFEQVTDREHRPIGEGILLVWHKERLVKIFLGTSMEVRYGPYRNDLHMQRIPRVLDLLQGTSRTGVPQWIEIEAHEQGDWLRLRFTVDAGVKVLLPQERDDSYTTIHELWGHYAARGSVRGQAVEFADSGFLEWARS